MGYNWQNYMWNQWLHRRTGTRPVTCTIWDCQHRLYGYLASHGTILPTRLPLFETTPDGDGLWDDLGSHGLGRSIKGAIDGPRPYLAACYEGPRRWKQRVDADMCIYMCLCVCIKDEHKYNWLQTHTKRGMLLERKTRGKWPDQPHLGRIFVFWNKVPPFL